MRTKNFYTACSSGNLRIMQARAVERRSGGLEQYKLPDSEPCFTAGLLQAATSGKLPAIRWLVENHRKHSYDLDLQYDKSYVLRVNVAACRWDIVKYLIEEAPKHCAKPVDCRDLQPLELSELQLGNQELYQLVQQCRENHDLLQSGAVTIQELKQLASRSNNSYDVKRL